MYQMSPFHPILVFCLFIVACTYQTNNNNDKIIFAHHITNGTGQNIWLQADSIQFENPEVSDNRVVVKTLWDNDSLYFLFQVADDNLQAFLTEKNSPC